MSIIGQLTKRSDGYAGSLTTLTISTDISIKRIEKTGDKSPDFRVHAGEAEIGAAWGKLSKDKKPYLSVKLDDPSFASAILCRLVESGEGYVLVWTR